jgi:hypothetical protein
LNEKEINRQLKRSSKIGTWLIITESVFIGFSIALYYIGFPQQVGFIIVGSLAIGFFWLFIQQKILKDTYKELLDYKFENLEKVVKTSSNSILDSLSKESTEVVDDFDFDIKHVKNKKDSELI